MTRTRIILIALAVIFGLGFGASPASASPRWTDGGGSEAISPLEVTLALAGYAETIDPSGGHSWSQPGHATISVWHGQIDTVASPDHTDWCELRDGLPFDLIPAAADAAVYRASNQWPEYLNHTRFGASVWDVILVPQPWGSFETDCYHATPNQ